MSHVAPRGHLLDEGVGVVGRVLAPVVPARARRPRRRRVRPAPAARQGALANRTLLSESGSLFTYVIGSVTWYRDSVMFLAIRMQQLHNMNTRKRSLELCIIVSEWYQDTLDI